MNTILFDLDGTLLPMDQGRFMEAYFRELTKKCEPLSYEAKKLVEGIWVGTKAMILNDGSASNETRFWDAFSSFLGDEIRLHEPRFAEFYAKEFHRVKESTTPTPLAVECVRLLKEKGYRVVLATNPIFPQIGIHARIDWAGLKPEDFSHITTYENSCHCKPNLAYYRGILKAIDKKPEECMMIGNDVEEDMCAAQLGMDTFLLTDHIVNRKNEDISAYKQGTIKDLLEFIKGLPVIGEQ